MKGDGSERGQEKGKRDKAVSVNLISLFFSLFFYLSLVDFWAKGWLGTSFHSLPTIIFGFSPLN